MKKFIRNVVVFCIFVFLSLSIYVFNKNNNQQQGALASEVFYAIDKSQHTQQYRAVLIGDSVCRQLFLPDNQNENNEVCYLGTNQEITVLGNYILLSNYLNNNPQTDEVIYFAGPRSFANNMGLGHSYQYFVIPFYNEENKIYIDEDTEEMLVERFGQRYIERADIKNFLYNNPLFMQIYLNRVKQQLEVTFDNRMSELAIKYLGKIRELCTEKGVKLRVICIPLSYNNLVGDLEPFRQDIITYGFEDIMGDYVDNIKFYDDSCFMDRTHFTAEYLAEHREDIIRNVFGEFPIY